MEDPMASTALENAQEALRALRKRDLEKLLESDERVRTWLGSGALLSTKQAAEFMGVERTRVWRYEEAGKIRSVADLGATKVYLKPELEAFLRENPPQQRRRRGAAAE
jgi:hypothetical protein